MSGDFQSLEGTLSLGKGVRVLQAHPCGLIALEKPEGILAHPNDDRRDTDRSLIRGEYDFKARKYHDLQDPGSVNEVYLVNRLDSATSGVILVCTNKELMPPIIRCFEKGRVKKVYKAIVQGRPRHHPPIWIDKMSVSSGPGGSRRAHHGDMMLARTEQQVIKSDANLLGLSLVRLMPITGRTHQLRYQCTKHHHPILGDANYGDFKLNRHFSKLPFARRLFLHACAIEVPLIIDGEKVEFRAESELPPEFDLLLSPNKEAKAISRFAVSSRTIAAAQRKRFGGYVER